MGQLVAQGLADHLVVDVAVVGVGADPQLDDLAPVAVQPQRAALPRRVLHRVHLREHPDRELVLRHRRPDPRVRGQPLQVAQRPLRRREVGERKDAVEGVCCGGEGLNLVSCARGVCGRDGFAGGVARRSRRRRFGEGG